MFLKNSKTRSEVFRELFKLVEGFSGHGFKISSKVGKIAADLLLNGKTEYKIDHFSPNRFEEIYS